MECVGFKPPEDLFPHISMIKPTVAKLLLRPSKPEKTPAVLQSALQRGQLALELPYAKQTAQAVLSSFPRHTALLIIHAGALQPFCSGAEHLIMQVHIPVPWEIGLGWDLSSKCISTLQAAVPESCRALYFAALFPCRVYTMVTPHFFVVLFNGDAFYNVLCKTWTRFLLLFVGCERTWDTDLCNASLRLLCKDAGFGYMWEVRWIYFFSRPQT